MILINNLEQWQKESTRPRYSFKMASAGRGGGEGGVAGRVDGPSPSPLPHPRHTCKLGNRRQSVAQAYPSNQQEREKSRF